MDIVTKFFGGAFALIALYLIVSQQGRQGVSDFLDHAASFNQKTFSTLQGRN